MYYILYNMYYKILHEFSYKCEYVILAYIRTHYESVVGSSLYDCDHKKTCVGSYSFTCTSHSIH